MYEASSMLTGSWLDPVRLRRAARRLLGRSPALASAAVLDIAAARRMIRQDWVVSPYYAVAEAERDPVFWRAGSPFLRMFERLDLRAVIELACGHGRHAARLLERAGTVTLVDVNASNIAVCRRRFAGHGNVRYWRGSGSDLAGLRSARYTALFCYDAMVHFELHDIIAYLGEFRRVLVPGGRALLHYSNSDGNPGASCHDNPHWRNFCSEPLFRHLAMRAGFAILESEVLEWDGVPDCDAVTLIERAT